MVADVVFDGGGKAASLHSGHMEVGVKRKQKWENGFTYLHFNRKYTI